MTIVHIPADEEMPGGPVQQHPVHELVYVLRGAYEVNTLGLTLSGSDGWLFCFSPRQRHEPRFLPRHQRDHCQALLLQWREPDPPASYPLQLEDASQRLQHVLSWMLDLYTSDGAEDRKAAGQLLPLLLRELNRPLDRSTLLLQSVHTYIEDHLHQRIELQDLADAVGLSRFHFAREFKQSAGLPPMRYVTRLRLQRAEHLLRTTHLPLAQIAELVGLSSGFHLSNLFDQHYGVRPHTLRSRTSGL
ncbi:MAG: helix-turn-helix domain-containing protein [Planctomycetota bacterium]